MGGSKEYKRDNYWDAFLVWEGEKTLFPKPSTFSDLIMIIWRKVKQYSRASTHSVCLKASTGTSVDHWVHQFSDVKPNETDLATGRQRAGFQSDEFKSPTCPIQWYLKQKWMWSMENRERYFLCLPRNSLYFWEPRRSFCWICDNQEVRKQETGWSESQI